MINWLTIIFTEWLLQKITFPFIFHVQVSQKTPIMKILAKCLFCLLTIHQRPLRCTFPFLNQSQLDKLPNFDVFSKNDRYFIKESSVYVLDMRPPS